MMQQCAGSAARESGELMMMHSLSYKNGLYSKCSKLFLVELAKATRTVLTESAGLSPLGMYCQR